MIFSFSIFIFRSFSACKNPEITNSSELTLFLQVRSGEYQDCTQIKGQLTIPSNCPLIGDYAFANCIGLYGNLIFETKMDDIGYHAFENTNFLRVIYKGSKEFNCTNDNIPANLPIYVSDNYNSQQLCGRDVIVANLSELIMEPIPEITDPPTPSMTELITPTISIKPPEMTSEITIPITPDEYTEEITPIQTTHTSPEATTKPSETVSNSCKHPEITDAEKVNISPSIIDDNEYAYCSQIKGRLELPSTITSIGSHAFFQCEGLTDSLEIPSKVEAIRDNAFDGCTGLNGNLVIDSELKEIGKEAFRLTNFSQILYKGQNEPLCGENPFPKNQLIYTTSEYKNPSFCGYPIVMLSDVSEDFEETIQLSSSEKVESIEYITIEETSEIFSVQTFDSTDDQTKTSPPNKNSKKKKLSNGAVVGIIVACVVVVIAVVAVLIYFVSIRRKSPLEEQLTSNTLSEIHNVYN